MRNFALVMGIVSLTLVSGLPAEARTKTLKERCTTSRCVYYETGKGRVATAKKDQAGRTVIRTRDGKRLVVKRDRFNANRVRFQIGE